MGAAASVDSVDNVDSAVMLLSSGGADADVVDKLPVPLIAVSWCRFLCSMYDVGVGVDDGDHISSAEQVGDSDVTVVVTVTMLIGTAGAVAVAGDYRDGC